MRLDAHGNPMSYRVLRRHPGGVEFNLGRQATGIPAQAVIHNLPRRGTGQGIPARTA